ncbi:DUF6456 domain-containing protein [Oryzibacter oryziterrae]|uniref:DUF6456 domain-containing protein n=1 Tax=Oryzibacter oryziterrae TaxID=2766474 RepID=UPI001F471DC6|nr:DUF6456 domain-containing protein [Oryzibacter oryziterrae]
MTAASRSTCRKAPSARPAETPQINAAESPLAWLFSRRDKDGAPLIAAHEFAAGERFRSDYTFAALMPRTTMNWSTIGGRAERRSGAGGGAVLSDAVLDARARVDAALTALGPDFGNLLIDVCCHLRGLVEVERDKAWPQRSGKVVLRLALAALARHYGLDPEARGGARSLSRQWGSPDFRPTLTPPPPLPS